MKLSLFFGAGCLVVAACGQPGGFGDDTTGDDSGTPGDDSSINPGDDATTTPDAPVSGPDGGPCTTNTGPITGSVGANGGSISRLVFGVVGDTRPANSDDPASYPTSIITKIFQDIEGLSPHPPFVLGTGDYQFSSTGSSNVASKEVGYYMTARATYSGTFFPAMGNHECGASGGFSTSDNNNCGPGNQGGATPNYNAFIDSMVKPITGQTNPYYAVNVNAQDNSWTAKIVVTAANAWDTAQESWLDSTLAQKTTYTFVVRHEASDATPPVPPGVAGVDAILAKYPYTLLIVGHAHTYGHYKETPQAVTIGNGGAPLTSKVYGYGLFSQRCDGAIVADVLDYQAGTADAGFHFVITPAGAITK
jgi:Calcineurin-like phosphoesterase